MNSDDFFTSIENQYNRQLPFVAYRKPNSLEIKGMLQKTDVLYTTQDFSASGFVFSPFDNNEHTVLIPLENSNTMTTNYHSIPDHNTKFVEVISEYIHSEARQNHINLIKKGIHAIENKQFDKVVLSRQEIVELSDTNPFTVLKNLLNTYKSALVYCWYHPKVGLWLGATPETLLKISGNQFSMMALAGTQDYKGTLKVDWQNKEKEEQQFVTDFIIKNLKPAAKNFKVSDVETVKAGNLVHLRTMISAQLKEDTALKQIIDAMHPTPAVCGVPKQVSKQFILNHENYKRDFYTGFLGELNLKTTVAPRLGRRNIENRAYLLTKEVTQLYVNLRCMQIKNNRALLYVGGGVTKDSNPEKEWQETVSKSLVIKNVLP
ncbi:isochorismate synthase [Pseudalgibacter alginicilyticus]|uniref:Isochorismate synthase n=1 Tax=Pseudalgibacter alginicilyticus TaxID=1736674 RepID=A0A0P0D7V8_9FLAO|nr:chorismate-binding protein [Pseudalgibacter alginicilyticus]ALJ03877.1 isochorismate synthase [Pseudalgibacter alginicilyticus]